MFEKILIANRGEIACRIMRSARQLGVATVAVYSDADADALHVRQADSAIRLGPAPAAESYLLGERVLQAALASGAEAIHPGYGFLSENTDFARACEAAGVVFIGPSADAIDAMGSKARAKALMGDAGVPLIPGYHGDDQSDERLRKEADSMGYPVLLKATAGGGGKGMRAVHSAAEFAEALAAARRESLASFADDRMLVEKLLQRPRHVEVQVFCDAHGNGVYLAERDCSIQRRHQKVIEEAPAPGLTPELRQRMGETALAAAKAIDYRGAGTVEFLLDRDGSFFFMEMNTRLQVEHPVTEMITGLDLVEWQLRVASGEPLPLDQAAVSLCGHAMEARIYAEDTTAGFLPSTGRIDYFRTPPESAHLRIDTGVGEGSEISPYYDPMIAKLIVHGATREEARRRLLGALRDFRVSGPQSNIEFLTSIATLPAFAACDLDTGFIERHTTDLHLARRAPTPADLAAAALCLVALRQSTARGSAGDPFSPWQEANAWRMNSPAWQHFEILCGDQATVLALCPAVNGYRLVTPLGEFDIDGDLDGDQLRFAVDGVRAKAFFARGVAEHRIFGQDGEFAFREKTLEVAANAAAAGDDNFAAPMHATVVALLATPDTLLAAGDPVIVLEAMKMEQTLRAPRAGRVRSFHYAPGDLVDRGVTLLEFIGEEGS